MRVLSRSRRNALTSTPCRGEARTARAKSSPVAAAIPPAVCTAGSPASLGSPTAIACPNPAAATARAQLSAIMVGSRSVSRYAVAGGTIRTATTRMFPTASNAATLVTATSVMSA